MKRVLTVALVCLLAIGALGVGANAAGNCVLGVLFVHSSSVYNHALAMFAAELSYDVYYPDVLAARFEAQGFAYEHHNYDSTSLPHRDIVAYTIAHRSMMVNGVRRNLVIVAIRGTYEIFEWRSNLRVWNWYDTHIGFRLATEDVYENLMAYKRANQLAGNAIVFTTGHSRGGAVANLLAAQLNNGNVYAYTFASPNVIRTPILDRTAQPQHTNIFNIINCHDPVPRFPRTIGLANLWNRHGVDRMHYMTTTNIPGFAVDLTYHHGMGQYLAWMQENT